MPAPHHSVLQAGCPSCRPTNSVKALKAQVVTQQYFINQCRATTKTGIRVVPVSIPILQYQKIRALAVTDGQAMMNLQQQQQQPALIDRCRRHTTVARIWREFWGQGLI